MYIKVVVIKTVGYEVVDVEVIVIESVFGTEAVGACWN